ncbi:hypothetical protein EVAR_74207_1 [Eumeta japonica]|uniref:Helitron helicase-like domain-containing protein n=1 Tax=Eumeta variegata TaxID=151549 RepID=A0A4C1SCM9_EUMVA|nr:hypothetical protein EVAR_74207_1 [Eumeta japonica]
MPKRSRSQLSRNSSQARASKIRRNEESSSETENRLSIHRQYVAQSRARESSTERSQRLAEQNMRTAQIRARESSLQRSQRLAEQNVRTSRVRARESSLERSERLADQNLRTSQARARESSLERSQRLAQQNLRTSQVRARESSLERSQRLTEQNLRTSHVHARESSTQRLQRLEEQNIRNIQSRTRESSSERFQRLQDQRERQQTSRARSRNQVLAHSNRSAFRYDPQIDYAQQSSVQIGDMNKICPKCSAKKWVDETNGMCCASGKVLRVTCMKTQDAMTYVRNYGRPDLFVTFTCNPEWPEIKAELLPDQRSFDRHDIISRVFHLKMKKFLNLFVKDEIFGKVKCYMASVEWQKRVNETQTGEDGYPVYRRRDAANGGLSASLNIRGRNFTIDNSWIVPYSPLLCRTFNAHINVEYCHSVQAIKYICKYINKGSDQATFGVRNPNDEVENYVNGRYISTSEAAWRIFEFPIHERHPTVLQLAVHLENGQRVYFTTETAVQVAQNPRKTTLLAFFELCNEDEFAKHFFTTKSRNTTHGPIISSPEGSVVRM